MIQSRYGSEVKIIGFDPETETVTARRISDGAIREYALLDLRADNGIEEISDAIARLGNGKGVA